MRHARPNWLLLLFVLPILAAGESAPSFAPGPDDVVEVDEWMVGSLNKQPLANMHVVTVRHPDGTRSTSSDSVIVIERTMGAASLRMQMSQTNIYREDRDGWLTGFQFHEDQNGLVMVARGTVDGAAARAVIDGPGGRSEDTIAIPAELRPKGMEAAQRDFCRADLAVGGSLRGSTLMLASGRVQLMPFTAQLLERTAQTARFKVTLDAMPLLPMVGVLDGLGNPQSMSMSLGLLGTIEFVRAQGPTRLGGAAIGVAGLVEAKGAPGGGPRNRYRLPAAVRAAIAEDAFQRWDGDILEVSSTPRRWPIADRKDLLAAEAQLEVDAPELRAWVATTLERVEVTPRAKAAALTAAVRSRLTGTLDRGDASALTAWRERKGDCSEYANLLTACLRIAGIPARVEVGIVYAPALGGWGGHAWVSASDEPAGTWMHLDAAYPGIARSCYIRSGSKGAGALTSLDGGISALLGTTVEVVP